MVLVEKDKQFFESEKVVLLDYLSIDVGRSQSLDLSDQKVSYTLDGLQEQLSERGRLYRVETSTRIADTT